MGLQASAARFVTGQTDLENMDVENMHQQPGVETPSGVFPGRNSSCPELIKELLLLVFSTD